MIPPLPLESSMPITVNCDCGHQFRVRDEYAGKKAQCPACGDPVMIPSGTFQPPTMNESPGDFPQMQGGGSPATFPGARRGGGQWFGGVNTGLFGLGRLSGLACVVIGLILVVFARGCESLSSDSAAAAQARYTLAQNEFTAEWEDDRNQLRDTIEDKQKELEDVETPAQADEIRKEIEDAQKNLEEKNEDEQRARRNKERGEWKELRRNSENAQLNRTLGSYWRELLFIMGTVVLVVGLLTVGFSGEKHERLVCLILIAIITISVFMGGISLSLGR
jgi:hypothetical protein